jgi:hypothetical protein
MQSRTSVLLCVCLGCAFSLAGQQPKHTDIEKYSNQLAISIGVDNNSFNATFQNQPLPLVAQAIAETTQIKIVLAEGLADDTVSLNVKSAAVDSALRELFSPYDTFVLYGGSKGRPSALRAVWVYPKGGASDVHPVPRSDWAGTRDLEATLGDTNTEVREAAYEALLERPDRRSRSLVLDAISGVSERDSTLRERLLSTALSKGFPLTPNTLTDLARTDPSEHIRWMALDALAFSEYSSTRAVAEAATMDTSENVRSRAREMLNQLNVNKTAQSPEPEIQQAGPER